MTGEQQSALVVCIAVIIIIGLLLYIKHNDKY